MIPNEKLTARIKPNSLTVCAISPSLECGRKLSYGGHMEYTRNKIQKIERDRRSLRSSIMNPLIIHETDHKFKHQVLPFPIV